jgi:hypothetical protein
MSGRFTRMIIKAIVQPVRTPSTPTPLPTFSTCTAALPRSPLDAVAEAIRTTPDMRMITCPTMARSAARASA